MSYDQVDAFAYSLSGPLRDSDLAIALALRGQGKVSVQTMRRLLSSDHRAFDGDRLPMRKDLPMTRKICFQMRSQASAEECAEKIKACASLGSLLVSASADAVIEIEFDKNADPLLLGSQAKVIHNCLSTMEGWQVTGPRCLGTGTVDTPKHVGINRHMEFAVLPGYSSGVWRCLQPGCMQMLNLYDSVYMTFREFSALIHRGSNRIPSVEKGDLLEQVLPDYLKKATSAIDQKQALERSLDEMHKLDKKRVARILELELALDKSKDTEKRLEALRQGYEDLTRKLNDPKNQYHDLKDLPAAADAMFRFLAGIGFQDRSVADQRKFLELMSELKKELKKAGIGSGD